jgi:pre-mRNA-splicing factor CDC5/CEF1
LDRYEKLLDAATLEKGDTLGEDARKMKVGEVDPHPETKPALPDAVDMEEEEKEMLQEARARMANTSGKKVKRKAREKQLEEARRLAVLQRKREMKAAGIIDGRGMGSGLSARAKRKAGDDWNKEIPFHHTPIAGFHDASEELNKPPPPVDFRAMSIKARTVRKEDEEERKRKVDLARQKQKMEADPVKALEELLSQAEARRASIRRASHLTTPQAQLSDSDFKTLSKMAFDPSVVSSSGSAATMGLLAPYTPASASTPNPSQLGKTPGARRDPLMEEASLQASRRHLQTPLLAGDMPPPSSIPSGSSNLVLGSWKDALSTPNPLATPLMRDSQTAMGPPSSNSTTTRLAQQSSTSASYNQTPSMRRDHFGLNTPSGLSTPIDLRTEQLNQKLKIQSALASLPTPKHTEFAIEMPEADDDRNGTSSSYSRPSISGPIDVADTEKKAKAEAMMEEQERLRMRSTAVKRGLPRPARPPVSSYPMDLSSPNDALSHAMDLLTRETMSIIMNDCAHWPVAGRHESVPLPQDFSFDSFSAHELESAKSLLDQEISAMQLEKPISFDQFVEDWSRQFHEENLSTNPSNPLTTSPRGKTTTTKKSSSTKASETSSASSLTQEEKIAKLHTSFGLIKASTDALVKKIAPLEKKLGVFHAGYSKRNEMISNEISSLVAQCIESSQDLASFQTQLERETLAQPQRLKEASDALAEAKAKEKELQQRYEALLERKQALHR